MNSFFSSSASLRRTVTHGLRSALAVLPLLLACIVLGCFTGCTTLHCPAGSDDTSKVTPKFDPKPKDTGFGPLPLVVFTPPQPPAGPPRIIFLLHELNGFTIDTALFADRLAQHGFTVYAPIMFGTPVEPGFWPAWRNGLRVILLPGWPSFRRDHSPAVLPDLHASLAAVRGKNPGVRIGVIGMCMTGTVPLALLAQDDTVIAAICQPAFPTLAWTSARQANLALAPADLTAGINRINAKKLTVLGFRFRDDHLSEAARFATIDGLLKPNGVPAGIFEDHTLQPAPDFPATGHPVFTSAYCDQSGTPTRAAFDLLVQKFTTALNP